MCEAHFIREAYFMCRRHISLAQRVNYVEKGLAYASPFSDRRDINLLRAINRVSLD